MNSKSGGSQFGIAMRALVMLVFAIAVYRAVVVSWADLLFRQATLPALEKAERLAPSNAVYHYTRALLTEQNDPASPAIEREFALSVAENPRYSDALMAWSVEREMRGDKAGSENLLLQAQSNDHLLRPAWALANYYYRQGNTAQFLKQAHEALRIIGISGLSEGRFNPNPIFELCWKSGAGAGEILEHAIPDIPVILGSYLSYLLGTGRSASAPGAADRMLPAAGIPELFFLRPYLERMLAENRIEIAAQTWRRFYSNHMVPYPGPDKQKNTFLTNGAIAGTPLDWGFDWRRAFPDTVQFNYSRAEHAYRFDFDGSAAGPLTLLLQVVPLDPSRTYRFQSRFESDMNTEQSGLRWIIRDHKTSQTLPAVNSVMPDGDAKMLVMNFEAPPGTDSADVILGYQRQPGTARLHGYYQLLHADLRLK